MSRFKRLIKITIAVLAAGYACLVAYAYWPGQQQGQSATSLAKDGDEFITVSGVQLRYRFLNADATGPTLVFLHGFGNALESFEALAEALMEPRPMLLFDLPGFGLSDKPDDFSYDNKGQAAVIPYLLDALNIRRAVVVGHSLGGAIAVHVAQDDRVCALALVNPGIISTGVPAGSSGSSELSTTPARSIPPLSG
jgi:pimeloyl-ACP methyl ester carboxylesterase